MRTQRGVRAARRRVRRPTQELHVHTERQPGCIAVGAAGSPIHQNLATVSSAVTPFPYLLSNVLVCSDAHVAVQVCLLLLLLAPLLLTLLSLQGRCEALTMIMQR
jgi:hypothetical protein